MKERKPKCRRNSLIRICSRILTVLYIPLSLFSMLCFMASELTIGATNQIYSFLVYGFCWVSLSIPVLCIICKVHALRLQGQKKPKAALFALLLPYLLFLLNLLFLAIVDHGYRLSLSR